MTRKRSPWAGAPYVWVWLRSLFDTVEVELGVSRYAAEKVLIPELVALQIHAQVPALNDHLSLWDLFTREGLVFQNQYDEAPRVSSKGWELLTRGGRFDYAMMGHGVRVRWAHVEEALRHLSRRAAVNALAGVDPYPVKAKKRQPSGVDYRSDDAPLWEEMRELIASNKAKGVWDAACHVAKRAKGHGSTVSKAKRLAMRFPAAFRAERGGED